MSLLRNNIYPVMKTTFHFPNKTITADLSKGFDISLPIARGPGHATAWYVNPAEIEPVRAGTFVGAVKEGGSVNFRNISFNPHGHGTHTECVGHITPEVYSVNEHLKEYFFHALLITVHPEKIKKTENEFEEGDEVITETQIKKAIGNHRPKAIIIRTLPNDDRKKAMAWSNTNPPYLDQRAATYLSEIMVDHLLIDLPSVDKENDNGMLLSHHAFWQYPHNTQFQRTITEFVFMNDSIPDGEYLLNLMVAAFENDATPSKPIIYAVINQ
jgi:arylformamidase